MAKCHATKGTGDPCGNFALRGQEVCRFHGGSTPQAKKAAARRLAEAAAERALADRKVWDQNATPTTDPVLELAALSGRIREAVATLGARLEATEPCVCCGLGEPDPATSLALRSLIKESRAILTDMMRHGIEERRVKVEERQAQILLGAMYAALTSLFPAMTDREEVAFRQIVLAKVAELEAVPMR